jgi:hypothetical protein
MGLVDHAGNHAGSSFIILGNHCDHYPQRVALRELALHIIVAVTGHECTNFDPTDLAEDASTGLGNGEIDHPHIEWLPSVAGICSG